MAVFVCKHLSLMGGGVVVRMSDLELKGPGFDLRVVPKSECMFVNICNIKLCLVLYCVFDCCFSLYNC